MTTSAVALADQVIVVDELVDAGQFGIHEIIEIRISPDNRKRFNEVALAELAESIKEHGVAQPILMRPVIPTEDQPEKYEIVAGERRYRASKIAGRTQIPAMVRPLTDLQAAKLRILENLQREDPHEMEEADGYQQLMMTHGLTTDQLIETVKKSRSYIYGRLKLCALTTDVRDQFLNNKINASTALLIARIPVPKLQIQALKEISEPPNSPGTPMAYRAAVEHIQKRYMLDLATAIFSLTDAKLLATAGACTKCPKRTGNQPEVFDGVSADVCTDPDCFGEKKAAQHAKIIVEANKNGLPIFEGKEATSTIQAQYSDRSKLVTIDLSLHYFKRNAPKTKNAGYVRDYLSDDQMPKPSGYVKNADGGVKPLYQREAVQAALEAAGACETVAVHNKRMKELTTSKGAVSAAKKQTTAAAAHQALEVKVEHEVKYRLVLYKLLRARGAESGFSLDALREFAKLALSEHALPSDVLGDIYSFNTRSDDSIKAHIDQAPLAEVQLILVDLLIGECFSLSTWDFKNGDPRKSSEYQALDAMARFQGIDPATVEKGVLMAAIPLADLTAHQVRDFIEVNPERINELAEFVMQERPLLVKSLEVAATDLGYQYRPMKDGGYIKRTGEDAQVPAASDAAIGDGEQLAKMMKDDCAALPPAKKRAAKPVQDSKPVKASQSAKPATNPPIAANQPWPWPTSSAKKAAISPAAAWPFPKASHVAPQPDPVVATSKEPA